jgi:hypothetical protein
MRRWKRHEPDEGWIDVFARVVCCQRPPAGGGASPLLLARAGDAARLIQLKAGASVLRHGEIIVSVIHMGSVANNLFQSFSYCGQRLNGKGC